MTVLRVHTNNYASTLNGALTNSATSIVVTSAAGLPSVDSTHTCNLTLDTGAGVYEIVTVTAVSSNTLTVVRGQEGTSAVSWLTAAVIQLRPTADSLDRKADLNSPTLITPALGTPASGALTNCTNIPAAQLTGLQPVATKCPGIPEYTFFGGF